MNEFEKRENEFTDRSEYTKHVQQFSNEEFVRKIQKIVDERKRI